jgi:predicted transcriptional regulator
VRPYAITRGRTAPVRGTFIGLIDIVVAANQLPSSAMTLGPEHRELLVRCQRPVAVADLASDVNLPTGVVRVLLSDLREAGFVRIVSRQQRSAANQRLLQEVLDGLRTL